MCNRYRVTAARAEVAARFGVKLIPDADTLPPPELFPKRPAWIVREVEGGRQMDVMQWGVPFQGKPITNVRNLASPFWRSMLATPANRCLVPVTAFAEPEGEKGSKVWRWFTLRADPIFSFAGIWRPTEIGNAFAFLTCGYLGAPANHIVGAVHPKACPVILHRDDERRWLDGSAEDACALAQPFPSQLITVTPSD
ncbi:MAG TPA: SOS response-associated peptidase family protein [Allosphingosinicella sp.]|nr:SOS response-associated peptidase family protein [Allosphingosinicella sp.]